MCGGRFHFIFLIVVGLLVTLCHQVKAAETVLEELVVTATKNPESTKDVPVKTDVITKEEMENVGAKNVAEAFKLIPGFYLRGENVPGASYWHARLRGLDFDRGYGLILIDGERVLGGAMGEYGISLNQLPPQMIERVEIVKGPGSVLYGSDALAGVVNIITKAIPEEPLCSFHMGYGSYDTVQAGTTLGRTVGHTGILSSFQAERSERSRYGGRTDEFNGRHALVKISHPLSDFLETSLKVAYDKMEWNYMVEEKTRISPSITYELPTEGTITLKGYWYKLFLDSFSPGYTPRKGNISYGHGEIRYAQPLWNRHFLTIGGEYLNRRIDATFADETDSFWSLYAQDEIEWKPFRFVIGGRIDNNSLYGTEFNPRFAALWHINESVSLRASVGRGFKSPTIRQLYVFFKHGNWWNRPNPDLEAEKSWGYDFNLEYLFGDKLKFDVGYFRNELEDMVVAVDTGETLDGYPVRTWKNVNRAYTQGVELSCKFIPVEPLMFTVNYTWLDTEDKETKKELPYSPHHTATVGFTYHIKPLDASIGWTTSFYSEAFTNDTNTSKLQDYSVSSIHIKKRITENVSLAFDADNLFDSDYGEPAGDWTGRVFFGKVEVNF
ncbi:TonB-dependent receptor plug domain-containing protein [Thermodesulforhabdus norvegica]|uniref:Outer membrane receptor for ferrienterochelin and colicins n=1 Tax=Thermodesulforhabdus norvegica TaxID=39841 RepID=A0A1I4RND3_9BACT|nr:TonB-dependent receptor [Thermodesulforhabdus norvegica]SFM53704.1 outer membrane receptor for ferrienterochelin and colicins [Thermodesulforhabdus norvegica]